MKSPKDRVIELNTYLVEQRHAYYVLSNPIITDQVYDALELELKQLITANPDLKSFAPVLFSVGSDLTVDGGRVKHITPMLSIDNCYTVPELRDWVRDIVERFPDVWFAIEPKVDGNSCSLHYVNRLLVKAVTRGDGDAGEDITSVMAASGAVPLQLMEDRAPDSLVEVRGEVWISKGRMDALNGELEKAGKKLYSSQRNLASGTMKLKDLSEIKRRGLSFQPWDCFGLGDEYLSTRSRSGKWRSQCLDYLSMIGFAQTKLRSVSGKDLLAGLERHLGEMQKERELIWHGKGLGMLTDGLVFKVDTPSVRDSLGLNVKSPNWARAYKFQDSKGETTLQGFEWYVSRNGRLTPVGVLDPIVLNGASIARVNLNNITYIESELGITEVPCRVEVCRSGDVIPIITRVIKESE
jgi:DNA ligase (NAD+)